MMMTYLSNLQHLSNIKYPTKVNQNLRKKVKAEICLLPEFSKNVPHSKRKSIKDNDMKKTNSSFFHSTAEFVIVTLGLSSGARCPLIHNTGIREYTGRWILMGKVTSLYQLVITTLKTLIWLELATCQLILKIRVRLLGRSRSLSGNDVSVTFSPE